MTTRVLVVTLVSAEPLLVRKWAEEGVLPELASLMAQGHMADVVNYPGFGNGSFWPSAYTGTDPSEHGRYYRRQLMPPDYSLQRFEFADVAAEPYWGELEREGFHVAVIDPVETKPARLKDGLEVLRWLEHGRIGKPVSWPPEAIDELLDRYGDDPFDGSTDNALRSGMPLEEILNRIASRVETKTDASLALLDKAEWDHFSVAYHDSHDAGHLAWHVHERIESGDAGAETEDPLKSCYRQLDDSIRRLRQAITPDGQIIIMMGPGMEPNVGANPLLPELLRAFQRRKRGRLKRAAIKSVRAALNTTLVPRRVRDRVRGARAEARVNLSRRAGVPYYALPNNDNAGAVRISLKGRDPNGIVAPEDYINVCTMLETRLKELKDASGRVPLVADVVRIREIFNGAQLDNLPDLYVVWNREADVSAARSDAVGKLKNPVVNPRTGDHSDRGMVISDRPLSGVSETPVPPAAMMPMVRDAVRGVANRPAQQEATR